MSIRCRGNLYIELFCNGMGTQCLGKWTTLFLGEIRSETWPSRLGKSQN
jgi:hypothetical protein